MGLAFHPDYATNGFFFVNYTCEADAQVDCQSDGDTIIARYSVSGNQNVADPGSARAAVRRLASGTHPPTSSVESEGGAGFRPAGATSTSYI